MLEKMTYFPFEETTVLNSIKMIVLFISGRKEVHSAGHSAHRSAKENTFLLFFLIFLIPEVK